MINGSIPSFLKRWCNIKHICRETYGKKSSKGMKSMLRYFCIPLEGKHHSGIDDSYNIAKIVQKIVREGTIINITNKN
jgi:ERI1 exoribonuclease 3